MVDLVNKSILYFLLSTFKLPNTTYGDGKPEIYEENLSLLQLIGTFW